MSEAAGSHIALIGGFNFRDLGGYPAASGHVRRGMVYRSASLASLSEADIAQIEGLGLRRICDLRSTRERTTRPTPLAISRSCGIWASEDEVGAGDVIRTLIESPDATPAAAADLMAETYRTLPMTQGEAIREIFHLIGDGALPVLFHCAVGKDRTGVAAALLLGLLGVPRPAIERDYLSTNQAYERIREHAVASLRSAGVAADHRVMEPVLRADVAYLTAMFEGIESRFGSLEAYFRRGLGLEVNLLDAIRARLIC